MKTASPSERLIRQWPFGIPAFHAAASPALSTVSSAILDEYGLTREHVYKFVLVFMPMTVGGRRSRFKSANVHAELCHASGTAKPFACAAFHSEIERRRIPSGKVQ